jgi:hypothetical protein
MSSFASTSRRARVVLFPLVGALSLAWGLHASDAAAQTEAERRARTVEARSVGTHRYSQFATVEWPFVATRVASRTGAGVDQFTLRGLEPDPEFEVDGEFAELVQSFLFGIRVLDWLGVEIEARGGALAGIDSAGALFVGGNGFYGLRVGGLARLVETELLLLTVRLDLTGIGAVGLAPARVVTAFLDDSPRPVSRLRPDFDGNIQGIGGSFVGALTATEWLGFMASVSVDGRRIEIRDNDETEGNLAGALGVSFDFGPLGVPFQLLLGTRVSYNFGDDFLDVSLAVVESVDDVRVEPELGFYYSDPDRPELELGLATSFVFTDLSERARVRANLAYWW